MQTAWKGAISFGLVSIPVRIHKATESHGVSLHQVHAADGGRVRMRRYCERCGNEVPYAEIAKGYTDEDGRRAVLTDADLAQLPLPSKKIVDVLAFVDAAEIDPISFEQSYYMAAEGPAAAKPYVLLREALASSGSVAVTKIAIRTRESLALLRVHDDVLVLHTMYWPDEVRSAAGLAPPEKVTVRPQELKMAISLMETLSEDFDLSAVHDEYQEALDALVAVKLEGKEAVAPPEGALVAPDNVIDLMAALQASIEARGEKRAARAGSASGSAAEAAEEPPREKAESAGRRKAATARKATTNRTPAKKAAPRKAAARKTTAGKSGPGSGQGQGQGEAPKKAAKKAAGKQSSPRRVS
jgi:DNA end-binding protein Ku